MNNPSNNQLTALAMMLVTLLAVCTMLCLTTSASAQTGAQHQQYQEDIKFDKQFMTKYERGLCAMYNHTLRNEAERMQRKAIRNAVAGIFFPVFLVPASIQTVRLIKCREELDNRRRYYSNLSK